MKWKKKTLKCVKSLNTHLIPYNSFLTKVLHININQLNLEKLSEIN